MVAQRYSVHVSPAGNRALHKVTAPALRRFGDDVFDAFQSVLMAPTDFIGTTIETLFYAASRRPRSRSGGLCNLSNAALRLPVPAHCCAPGAPRPTTAGRLACLTVLRRITEPTAAALASGLEKLDEDHTVFVFDLGGGTFDVTVMRIKAHCLEMVATNGDHRLGGQDWDDVIVNWVAEEFDRQHGENPLLDLQSYQDLQSRALAAKIQLSSRDRTTIVHSHNGQSVKIELTSNDFEKMTKPLGEKSKAVGEIGIREGTVGWATGDKGSTVGG